MVNAEPDLIRRGLPMSLFSLVNMTCTGFGPMVSGWIEFDPHLQWRWIQWLHAMLHSPLFILIGSLIKCPSRFSGVYFVISMFTLKETRQSIILRRLAQKMRKETGDSRYRARVEETQPALRELVWISCTRPIRRCSNLDNNITSLKTSTEVLLTEPIAMSISVRRGNYVIRLDRRSNAIILTALGVLHVGRSVLLDQVMSYLFVSFYSLWYLALFRPFSKRYMGLMMAKAEWYTPPSCK